ncbi:unnamed protein product [Caenorhabditis bovis]|uniref:Inosine/uridine-preferring nucleoside hydrolase domain-containing protein n=1 Tax=Caenorhabditis bovis TaxID=2654633 RepID=A0A8S1FBA2_9PELO|nr:unnamed protein product [Caenorhabditis bovis]
MLVSKTKHLLLVAVIFVSVLGKSKKKIIIDTDGVYDDVRSLIIALTNKDSEVVGITTVHGGVSVEQATANIVRTLRATNCRNIPVFRGANDSLVPKGPIEVWQELYGSDGIGDVPNSVPKAEEEDNTRIARQSAVEALLDLTKQNQNVTLVCLGPLTNIANAIKNDSTFVQRLGGLVLMGGNYLAVGNTLNNSTAEFNFLMDPEAAQIVLSSIHSTIIPWDTSFFKGPEYAKLVDYEASLKLPTPLSRFLNDITKKGKEFNAINGQQYAFVDDIAVAVAISEKVALKKVSLYANVQLEKSITRGQVTIDWLGTSYNPNSKQFEASSKKNEANWLSHEFVTEYDVVAINEMLISALKFSECTVVKKLETHGVVFEGMQSPNSEAGKFSKVFILMLMMMTIQMLEL